MATLPSAATHCGNHIPNAIFGTGIRTGFRLEMLVMGSTVYSPTVRHSSNDGADRPNPDDHAPRLSALHDTACGQLAAQVLYVRRAARADYLRAAILLRSWMSEHE